MSSVAAPFGLQAVSHESGAPIRLQEYSIASGYAANIFQGSPVKIHTDGTIQVAAAGDRLVGVFVGCEYTDTTTGDRRVQNRWPTGTVSPDAVARVITDPDVVYRIQSVGSVPLADIGNMADHSGVSGNTVTGISTTALDTQSATVESQYQIIGFDRGSNNAAGDAFTIVLVKIAEHQFRALPDAAQAF
jgi:hypothetical protein